jgi:hypothetical protein
MSNLGEINIKFINTHWYFLVLSKVLSSFDSHCGQYGCCADGHTPSPDPAKAGCPQKLRNKAKSPGKKVALQNNAAKQGHRKVPCFEVVCGCCPDGVSVAMGPNFQGCGVKRPSVPKGSCFYIFLKIITNSFAKHNRKPAALSWYHDNKALFKYKSV